MSRTEIKLAVSDSVGLMRFNFGILFVVFTAYFLFFNKSKCIDYKVFYFLSGCFLLSLDREMAWSRKPKNLQQAHRALNLQKATRAKDRLGPGKPKNLVDQKKDKKAKRNCHPTVMYIFSFFRLSQGHFLSYDVLFFDMSILCITVSMSIVSHFW